MNDLRSRSQNFLTTESTYKLSRDDIDEMQAEAEQFFSENKYLQSVQIAAKIAEACNSKEYAAEVVAKFNLVCVNDLIAKSKFKAAALVLKEVLTITEETLNKDVDGTGPAENLNEYQNLHRLTLNNLGCALKKSGQIDEAQHYFEQITNQDPLYELNLCAVQNKKGNHRQALIHAQQAASLLEMEVKDLRAQFQTDDQDQSADKDYFLERTSLLAIAYYNQGCELEHLNKEIEIENAQSTASSRLTLVISQTNLIRATQAFSRAVNLQSSKHANQNLLSQFKISLKQSRIKLRQQMIPKQQYENQSMHQSTMSVPIFPDKKKFGAFDHQLTNESHFQTFDKRPNSAFNQFWSPNKFQNTSGSKQLPKIVAYQTASANKNQTKPQQERRRSVQSNHTHASDLSDYQQTLVDQMIQRPKNDQKKVEYRGKKQASQNGPSSNSLRQKQLQLQANQSDLGTGIPFKSQNARDASFNSKPRQNSLSGVVPPTPQRQSMLSQQAPPKPKIAASPVYSTLKDLAGPASSQLYKNGTVKNQTSVKVAPSQIHTSKATVPNYKQQSNAVSRVAAKPFNIKDPRLVKCAKLIQSYIRRRRFRQLVHAMIIRRKVSMGYLSKDSLQQIAAATRKRLENADKKTKNVQVEQNKLKMKQLKAVRMVQRLFRIRRFRKIVASVMKARKQLLEKPSAKMGESMKKAFIAKLMKKANEIRKAELIQDAQHRVNLKRSVRVLQTFIRRRRFRKAVYAMILFRNVNLGRVSVKALKSVDAQTYQNIIKIGKFRKAQEKQFQEQNRTEKAVKLIQSLIRRRRFRKLVHTMIKIMSEIRGQAKSKYGKKPLTSKEKTVLLDTTLTRYRKQIVIEAQERARTKKAVAMIQSFLRRRRFRRLVEASIILHKFKQGKVKASALARIDPSIRKSILNAQTKDAALQRKQDAQEKKKNKSAKMIQSLIRRRRFRQLVNAMVQVRRLANQQLGRRKNAVLTEREIIQLGKKANELRRKNFNEMIEKRSNERKAMKVIRSFFRRYRLRRVITALIQQKRNQSRKQKVPQASQVMKAKLIGIGKYREAVKTQQQREDACTRILQSFIRRRRFRQCVEAIVLIQRKYRESDQRLQVNFQIKLYEAGVLRKQLVYERTKQFFREKAAATLLRSFIRRRNFRKVVEAIILQIRIKNGKAKAKELQNLSPFMKKQLALANNYSNQVKKVQNKEKSAARVILSWYRRRKFQKVVEAIVFLKRLDKKGKAKSGYQSANKQQAFENLMTRAKKHVTVQSKETRSYHQKLNKAVRLVQRWFRRRRFRELVFAMIVRTKVAKKKVSSAALAKVSKETLDRLRRSDVILREAALCQQKEDKAVRLIQSLFRRRRFRSAIYEVIEAKRQLGGTWQLRSQMSEQQINAYYSRLMMKASFIRRQNQIKEKEYRLKVKKSAKMIISYYRRRQFRNLIAAAIALKKQTTSQGKAKVLSGLSQSIRRMIELKAKQMVSSKPSATYLDAKQRVSDAKKIEPYSRNQNSMAKVVSQATTTFKDKQTAPVRVSKTPSYAAKQSSAPLDLHSTQKIVIDYWQDGMQVVFQQAIVTKKPIVVVTLVINDKTVDRKVIQIDLYHCALDAGDYDLKHFCDQQLMPCLQIKEKNGTYTLQILEELVQDIQARSQPAEQNFFAATQSTFDQQSFNSQTKAKSLHQKLTGMMPLVKRIIILNNKKYTVQAICDFDMNIIKLTAEREDAYLFINVPIDSNQTPRSEELPTLCTYANDLTHQLVISKDKLKLRKAVLSLHDDEVVLRTSKLIQERFYLVSVGLQNGVVVIEALDKARERSLMLKLNKTQVKGQMTQEAAMGLVEKLDTNNVGSETTLVLN